MIDGKNNCGDSKKQKCERIIDDKRSFSSLRFTGSIHFQFALIGFLIGLGFGALILAIITKL
jgi:hypothetical protein